MSGGIARAWGWRESTNAIGVRANFEGDGDNACGFIDRGDRGIDLLRTALRAAL